MATGNAKKFVEIGVAPRLARELATQITASVGNARRLRELGMIPTQAAIVVPLITSHSMTTILRNRLAETGMPGRVIREFAAQIAS